MVSSIFHFGQISKFKKGVTPKKKWNQNFLCICPSTHFVLHNHKVSKNSVERFQRSCANKKTRTDGLTDWLTDGWVKNIIPSATRCVGYKKHFWFYILNVYWPFLLSLHPSFPQSFLLLSFHPLPLLSPLKNQAKWLPSYIHIIKYQTNAYAQVVESKSIKCKINVILTDNMLWSLK